VYECLQRQDNDASLLIKATPSMNREKAVLI
jgi:hypothetical protein